MDHTAATRASCTDKPGVGSAHLRAQSGQVLVLNVMLLTVLLGMSALVIDVGSLYRAKRHDQAVVDAAALAAAQALPGDTSSATDLAIQYAQKNGGSISSGDITFSSSNLTDDTVKVHLHQAEPTFFAKIFGLNSVNVGATAAARASGLGQAQYAAPFGIVNTQPELAGPGCPCFHVSTTLDLFKVGPGGFKIMNIDGSRGGNGGPGTLADWIQNGFNGLMPLGWYYSMPGAKFNSSQVKAAMDARLGSDLLFPVYDLVQGNGANLQYHVIGWAAFNVQSYNFHGNTGTISGWFDHVTWTGIESTSGGSNFGAVVVGLVE